ncbi:MAG: adenylate/guanylate cyclase domain-containing protein [Chloroflexi bacterium]|nr:adenylate/guanylate cyclase domain-containing protein [Chloroflexota bacterium]
MTETAEQEFAPAGGEIRTFLIADVRGYTRFTLEHGDEAAARLASRFAAIAREGVAAHEGQILELRGDEALAVFSSARQALRAAVDLQERFSREAVANSALPFAAGIGLDAGEAVPVEGGYRGAALNLAARLCALAGPGEVLASDGVIHLARRVEGLEYADRGPVTLKGFADQVRVMQVRREPDPAAEGEDRAIEEASRPARIEQQFPIGGFLGSLPAGPLVGRSEELGRILAAMKAVGGGEGRLVLLAGEPGASSRAWRRRATSRRSAMRSASRAKPQP